jgi:multidrug transporter EmrE-like cation transporter
MGYFYIFGTIACTVYGQLILKWRIEKFGALPSDPQGKFFFFLNVFKDPLMLSGLAAAFIASLFWIAAMTKFDLSYAYPFITAGLTFITVILAVTLLGEPINLTKFLGSILMLSGVALIGYSRNA